MRRTYGCMLGAECEKDRWPYFKPSAELNLHRKEREKSMEIEPLKAARIAQVALPGIGSRNVYLNARAEVA
jgi:hypothetical protein